MNKELHFNMQVTTLNVFIDNCAIFCRFCRISRPISQYQPPLASASDFEHQLHALPIQRTRSEYFHHCLLYLKKQVAKKTQLGLKMSNNLHPFIEIKVIQTYEQTIAVDPNALWQKSTANMMMMVFPTTEKMFYNCIDFIGLMILV